MLIKGKLAGSVHVIPQTVKRQDNVKYSFDVDTENCLKAFCTVFGVSEETLYTIRKHLL